MKKIATVIITDEHSRAEILTEILKNHPDVQVVDVSDEKTKILIDSVTRSIMVSISEIVVFRFSPQDRCWHVMLNDGTEHKLKKSDTAKRIMEVSRRFIRLNQNVIANQEYVSSIENKTLKCLFVKPFQDLDIVVSRSAYKEVRENMRSI